MHGTHDTPEHTMPGGPQRHSSPRPAVRSSGPEARRAHTVDDTETELPRGTVTDLAWVILEVAHRANLRVRDLRWSLSSSPQLSEARRVFYLVAREVSGVPTDRMAVYINRSTTEVEAELQSATKEQCVTAAEIATALVIERRKAEGSRR